MSEEQLSLPERWAMAVDWAEYFVRRSICRIFGHRDEGQYEDLGDQRCYEGEYCLTCHRFKAARPTTSWSPRFLSATLRRLNKR